MDLIAELAGKLGIDASAAQALAGAVLGGAQTQLAGQVGEAEAAQMGEAIPELTQWKASAAALDDGGGEAGGLLGGALGALGGGGGGNLLGALGGALGGGSAESAGGPALTALTAVLGKLDLNPSVISTVAPLILSFLQERLPPELLDKVKYVVPLLSGDAGGALGSLLGR